MIDIYYKKELQSIIAPMQIGRQYFNWDFKKIILNRIGPYFLQEIIFYFLKDNNNALMIYLRKNNEYYQLDYQVLNDELSAKKIFILFDNLLIKKQIILERSLVFAALQNNEKNFLNRLSQIDEKELIKLLSLPEIKFINNNVEDSDIKILFDFNLNSFGLGDYLMSDRSLIKNGSNNFIITDLYSVFEGNKNFNAIYSDLNLCFSENGLLDKTVELIDYNTKLDYLDENLKNTYHLFLYNQFYKLIKNSLKLFNFKEYQMNPQKGIDLLLSEINKIKKINIHSLDSMNDEKNELYLNNKEFIKIIGKQIKKNKKIIGISANYAEGFPDNAPKGWALANWLELINLLSQKFNDLHFFLLPVNNEDILNIEISENNYHFKIFNNLKDKVDLVFIDELIKKYIFKKSIFDNILLKNTSLEFLKTAISFCDLVIALDSAPAHMAASLEVPVVSLFSEKGDIRKFKPLGDKSFTLHKEKEGEYLNINNISAQEVFDLLIKENLIIKRK
ncbi:MAG: hypothetical protein GF365_00745 [Candidatus Buchananbacteria bacterium]|nr:hypothetical protein [Candidatus Buchananbacteria bacterium]